MKKLTLLILIFITLNLLAQGNSGIPYTKEEVPEIINEIESGSITTDEEIENVYYLQRGDKIKIEVMEHPEFSKDVQVLPDGTIEYPILGKIRVENMSVSIFKNVIKDNLKPYVPIPVVTIYVTQIYGERVNIIGYVNQPGSYQIYKPIDLVDAIAIAGGITNIRKVKYVKIIRRDGIVLNIKLSKIWFSENQMYSTEGRILLKAGDSLIVPPPMEFNWSMISAIVSIISLGITIYTLTL
ncbi:MAG: polysaccharide export protein [Candidatus Cloacimonetes bacterium]|jgi:polysaccharide export outer membrane protein|nr:polysaccharide export protein [Candidatus Cloacimonadota bacterium]MBT4332625.1 polysaccharide export protein [Candidatus Cloacimonadota bacterium]MBT4575005.1 polysaccharide export protein [Candidatus Cloacimonadota bacterium]MBT5420744.1 polysaccharide export protein [Candidatus Cloacimonadota bacterium]